MRPLHLRLSGLHSYREEVSVDFTALSRFGLFGIFGDIGSGKSTLLDGITLALYGVIDRVHGRSRRGIVNHHVDRIDVTFRFAVGEIYEVQRAYKRDANGIAQRMASRICRVESSGALSVIADKEREVNDTVRNLLGLTSDDLMRAVVLPQGRFMEFLHLKGSERRAMLQRIFRLSAYGEGLRTELRQERERCERALETHRGELRGLGDASAAAVATARKHLDTTEASLTSIQAEFERLATRHERAADGRRRQLAFTRAEALLAQHADQRATIRDVERRLERAEIADRVSEPALAWTTACREATEAETLAQAAATQHDDARSRQTSSVSAAARARAQLAEQTPTLRGQIGRLERAGLLAAQLSTVETEAARIEAERHRGDARAAVLEAENAELTRALNDWGRKRAELSTEFTRCQIPSDVREQLLVASSAHRDLTAHQARVAALRGEIAQLDDDPSQPEGTCPTCGSVLSLEARREHLSRELEQARRAELEGWSAFERDSGGLTFFDIPHRVRDLSRRDRRAAELYPELQQVQTQLTALQQRREATAATLATARQDLAVSAGRARTLAEQRSELLARLSALEEHGDVEEIEQRRTRALTALETLERDSERTLAEESHATALLAARATEAAVSKTRAQALQTAAEQARSALGAVLRSAGLDADTDLGDLQRAALPAPRVDALRQQVQSWHQTLAERRAVVLLTRENLPKTVLSDPDWNALVQAHAQAQQALDTARTAATTARLLAEELTAKAARYATLQGLCAELELRLGRLNTLSRVLRGNRFIEYIANDYLEELAQAANAHLATLTGERYQLQLDDDGGFLVRDEDGGGALRPVTSLSGGETFVTSLALALALSTQVQERSTQPLELFFLDEGFGTLDGEALDRVMTAIESLQSSVRTIGVISHVPAVRERVPRYVMVAQPDRNGAGSRLSLHDN